MSETNNFPTAEGGSETRKRCPFCGGPRTVLDRTLRDGYAEYQDDPDAWAYSVRCVSCAATGGWAKHQAGAERWWGMRSAHPAPAAPGEDAARLEADADLSDDLIAALDADLLEAQEALVLLANQLEHHSIPFVPDAESATAKARRSVEEHRQLVARGVEAAAAAFRAARAQEGNPLANIIGQWPGDETDEEIEAAMQPAREETVGDAIVQGLREAVAFERGEIDATVRQIPHPAEGAGETFRSMCCVGERCLRCGRPADGKIEEVIFHDDPQPIRHPLTAYLCKEHMRETLIAAVPADAGSEEPEGWRDLMADILNADSPEREEAAWERFDAAFAARLRTVEAERDRLREALNEVATITAAVALLMAMGRPMEPKELLATMQWINRQISAVVPRGPAALTPPSTGEPS